MKVAILGTVPDSRIYAPFEDSDWDIWVCSAGNRGGVVPRVSAWFELHSVTDLKGHENRGWVPDYFAWLRSQSFPVYMQEPSDLLPQALVFPARTIRKRFGDRGRINLTSSIAWMIAFAIMKGAHEIGIFGVDMAATEEYYGQQKSGCLNWIQIAREHDITVTVPLESCLSTMPPLYGYADGTPLGRRLVVQELSLRDNIARLHADIGRLTGDLHMMQGALDRTQYIRRTFVDGEEAELDLPADAEDDAFPAETAIAQTIDASETDFARMPASKVGEVLVPNFAMPKAKGARAAKANGAVEEPAP